MKRLMLLFCLLFVLTGTDLFSQSKSELKNSFYDAESWILFEAYRDALPIYLQLAEHYPDNANFKYRIGQCYLNISGAKEKAIPFLEEAVTKIDSLYKEGKFKEKGAPYDAYYYLANAYRINNQLDMALETYDKFKKNMNTTVYDTAVVNLQIQSCINAKDLISRPKKITWTDMGEVINEGNSDYNPVMSDDEKMIVFSRSEAFYDALLYSVRTDGQWSQPQNMNEILKVDRDLFPTSLSHDGKTLYLYSSADYDGIIYSSQFENGTWSPIVRLNDNINTKYWESHATISHDNSKLYFTSNRKGTYGGLDIWVSKRDSSGDWGVPANLGPVINTPYNEESPFLSKDDKTLYFSSRGHYNMGGYDIFSSRLLANGQWSEPENIGYPLNTTDDDIFFKPSVSRSKGFFAAMRPEGAGKQDIYQVEIFSQDQQRKFIVTGLSSVAGLLGTYSDSVRITVMKAGKPGETTTYYTNPRTHEYDIPLAFGDYNLTYEGSGGEKVSRDISLPLEYEEDSFRVPATELPRTDFRADLTVEGKRNITVSKGDSLSFNLNVEPLSSLTIENWLGNSMISFQKHQITAPYFTYKMAPEKGNNKVIFKLTDRFDNSATEEVSVRRISEEVVQKVVRPEYTGVIVNKQRDAYIALLKNRSDDQMLKLITESRLEKQQISKLDEINASLRQAAGKKDMDPALVDLLALRVAVNDNVLTQAAVNVLAANSDGEMKNILSGLDIYAADIKTWTDLQRYISDRSGNRMTADDLGVLAAVTLGGTDPGIAVMKEKILTFSDYSKDGNILKAAVAAADKADLKKRGKWMEKLCSESMQQGLTPQKLSVMLAVISSMPDTQAEKYLNDLAGKSEEPLFSALRALDLKKENIKAPENLLNLLVTTTDRVRFPGEAVWKSVSNLIVAANIPADTIKERLTARHGNFSWILWPAIGIILILIFIFWSGKRRKEKKEAV
jgi:tetratricopeptide (TPR) repeat protein